MQPSFDDNNERKKSNYIVKRLFIILSTWCKHYGRDLSRDEVYNGMMETLEEVFIKGDYKESEELKSLIQETHENFQNATDDNKEDPLTSLNGPPVPLSL